MNMRKLTRITVDPRLCMGQPTIRGLRITVSVLVKMLAAGKTIEDVVAAYPELERQDVLEAMEYAAWAASDQIVVEQLAPA
jgi:uncharacterized protein (DUF433 family)